MSMIFTAITGSASRFEKNEVPGEKYHCVLQGAALADLPDPVTDSEVYLGVRCPVLILTIEGDDTHPVSTATTLYNILPSSQLHVAPDKESAERDWPEVVSKFLLSLPHLDSPTCHR